MQTSFAEKIIYVEGSVTFQNIFSSMVHFRAVVSVLPCSATNKGKQNLSVCAEKANRQCHRMSTLTAFADCLAQKKDALFSLMISLGHSAYITFHIVMSFRKPCHMPLRKLIPHFTLTAHRFRKWIVPLRTGFCASLLMAV